MGRMIFPNLPVKDVPRTVEFWTRLGFEFNHEFSSPEAACLVINEQASVMLLSERFFHGFHDTAGHTGTEVLMGLGVESREEVDRLCDAAAANGGSADPERTGQGSMYGGCFRDLDGHIWEPLWMATS
ncbi:VOC family protein [Nocardioides jensenii]|uniref:VOC family protein n=1 Tax=Nocardioides jensenii TaxID=1843 RepID=UPI000830CE43|nr:VOC family protein [Nocardioides jensenii]